MAIAQSNNYDFLNPFTRLAVTPQQVAELRLPTALPKPTDRRTFKGMTAQVEAIAPDTLAKIIHQAIKERINHAAFASVLAEEEVAREALLPILRTINAGAP